MPRNVIALNEAEADLVYSMLTQRLYLREDDPERELVQAAREQVYPATSARREHEEAARELPPGGTMTASERIRAASFRAAVADLETWFLENEQSLDFPPEVADALETLSRLAAESEHQEDNT